MSDIMISGDYVHPELRNIAEELDEEELKKIAATCLEEYKADEESRAQWLEMHAQWLRLYFLTDKAKNPPWEGASQESLPMLAEACNQFHARAYQAMFPSRNFIRAIPVGRWDPDSEMRSKRVSSHLSWQLLVKDRTYKRNKDRLLLSVPLHGSFFTKTYHCPVRKRNITDNVRAADFVVPYGNGPRDLEDLDRKTEIIWITQNQTKILERDGFFSDHAEPWARDESHVVDRSHDEVQGLQKSETDKSLCKVIEQHRLLDLDDDGIEEPYIVWVDCESEKVLRIGIRYDTDELGNPTDNKRPVEYYTHYCFMENPDGFYGLGYGHIVAPLNTAVNKLMRETIDAGELANIMQMSGIINKQMGIKKGEVELQLGKFITSESSLEDIQKAVWQPKVGQPSPVLTQIMEVLLQRGDRLAMVTEALTGQTEAVMQPQAIMALVEQGLQVFSGVLERLLVSWGQELEKHFRLNRKYMDPVEYFTVQDMGGAVGNEQAAREDYRDDLQIVPIADAKNATKQQRLAKAQFAYQILSVHPLVMGDPTMVAQYKLAKRLLEEAEVEWVDEVLPTPEMIINAMGTMATAAGNAALDTGVAPEISAAMGGIGNMGQGESSEGSGGGPV